jgi:hypothetical protein
VLWAISIAAVYLQAIYQRASTTLLDNVIAFLICIVAGIALMDLGKAILGYFAVLPTSMILVFLIVALPALDGTVAPPGDSVIATLWLSIIIKLVFPAQMLLFLVGAVIGSYIGEKYL